MPFMHISDEEELLIEALRLYHLHKNDGNPDVRLAILNVARKHLRNLLGDNSLGGISTDEKTG